MKKILKEDLSHKKVLVFNDPYLDYKRNIQYPIIEDYFLHYLKYLGIEARISDYIDTISDNNNGEQVLIDRHNADFYRNGKKLKVKEKKYIYIYSDGIVAETIDDSKDYKVITYCRRNILRETIERWQIQEQDWENVYSLGLSNDHKNKQISLEMDDFGNIIIYINENANDISYFPARYRRCGQKYFIPFEGKHLSAHEYIEMILKLINRKHKDQKIVELFELMIKDPRLENHLSRLLNEIEKLDYSSYKEKRKKVEDEYFQKLKRIKEQYEEKVLKSTIAAKLSDEYNTLVPERVVKQRVRSFYEESKED